MDWFLRVLRGIETLIYLVIFAGILGGSSLLISNDPTEAARRYTRAEEFDFVGWTLQAFAVKLDQAAIGTPFYFTQAAQHKLVVDYLHLMDSILTTEDQVNKIYADPTVQDPAAASQALRTQLDGYYARQVQLAPMAEAVLQAQISEVLASQGLTTGGQPMPPVLFHITPLPYDLIVSPRNVIEQVATISLDPNLSVDKQVALESKVDAGLNVSSLVVPVGGIGVYPTMVMRTTSLDWLSDTIAHEWTHNWLTLLPLGLNYDTSPQLRTMNETTAEISGGEISALVLKTYYPEVAAQYGLESASLPPATTQPAFDFNNEMHITRVHADELLAQGQITEAENYMDQRRLFFYQNGYAIRKLNQAYFAFYGAYASVPGGAAGEDPVGPAVRALRAESPTLAAFLKAIARMDSFQQLQAAVAQ